MKLLKKQDIAKFGVTIASKHLGLSGIEVEFQSQEFFKLPEINAMFIQKTYTIIFNSDWIEQVGEFESLKCAFHDIRLAYQRASIDFHNLIKKKPDINTINTWKNEFYNYNNPSQSGYLEQSIELNTQN